MRAFNEHNNTDKEDPPTNNARFISPRGGFRGMNSESLESARHGSPRFALEILNYVRSPPYATRYATMDARS